MSSLFPNEISYLTLLQALGFKFFIGDETVDEAEFSELVIDLAGLHYQVCSQNRTDPGALPCWIDFGTNAESP